MRTHVLALIASSLCALAVAKTVPLTVDVSTRIGEFGMIGAGYRMKSVGMSEEGMRIGRFGRIDEDMLKQELARQFTMRSLPCTCADTSCSCCAGINIERIGFNQQGCVNFLYDRSNLEVAMNVLANNRTLYETKISGKNLPPFCVPIPQFPVVMFCARFYDIHQDGGNIVSCVKLEVIALTVTVLVINFDCVRVGFDGVSLIKPAQLQEEPPMSGSKPLSEVVILLQPGTSGGMVPTYDVSLSVVAGNQTGGQNETETTSPEVDDLDAVEEDVVRGTTTKDGLEAEEDYDDDEETDVAAETTVMPSAVDAVVKVKRIVNDYRNYSMKLGEPFD